MALATEKTADTFLNIVVDTPIDCDWPLYAEDEVEVVYGSASLLAVYNTDYTVTLSAPDYDQFQVTPLASLLTKINDLIASDPEGEENYITVRRVLDYKTSVTPESVRGVAFLSREVERIHMRLQQLSEAIYRAVVISDKTVGQKESRITVQAPVSGATLVGSSDETSFVAGPTIGQIESAADNASDAADSAAAALASESLASTYAQSAVASVSGVLQLIWNLTQQVIERLPLTGGRLTGRLGVNVTPEYGVHAKQTANDAASGFIVSENEAGDVKTMLRSGTAAAVIGTITNHPVLFYENDLRVADITNGAFTALGGLRPSSGSDAITAYAQGTFTPTLISSGGGTPTYTVQSGRFTRIGNMVFCRGRLTISSKAGLSAGNLRLGGLPLTIANQSNARTILGAVSYTNTAGGLVAGEIIAGFGQQNDTFINLTKQAQNSNSNLTVANIVDTFDIQFNFSYEAA